MKIEILGTGCTKYVALFENTKQAVAKIGGFHEVKKVEEVVKIMNYGEMSTQAILFDVEYNVTGKLLSVDEVYNLLKN